MTVLRRITRPVIILGSRVLAPGWQCRECAGEWLDGEGPFHDPDCLARPHVPGDHDHEHDRPRHPG